MVDEARAADAALLPPDANRQGLPELREHRTFIVLFVVSAMLTALLLTYIYSERYQATTTIYFKPSDVMEMNRHTAVALGSQVPAPTLRNLTQTISTLASSDLVLRSIVKDLHLDAPQPRDLSGPWYVHDVKVLKYALGDYVSRAWVLVRFGRIIIDNPVDAAIAKLRKDVKVSNDDSYVYSVAVSAATPQAAAAISDKLAAILSDLLLKNDRLSFDGREAELVRLRDQKSHDIEAIEAAVQRLLASHQVASIDDALTKLTDRLSQLQQKRSDTQADLDQSQARVEAASEKLRVAMPAAAHDGNPAPAAHASRISPEDYGKLTTKKLDAEVDSRGLRARLAAEERAYTGLLPQIDMLTNVKAQDQLLAARLSSAKRDYAALTDAVQELTIRKTTSESELHIEAKAVEPALPVSPIKIYHVLAAGVLAAFVAIGLAFVLDYFKINWFLPPAPGRRRSRRLSKTARGPDVAPIAVD